jgi:type 1 glutamine amidotransferase
MNKFGLILCGGLLAILQAACSPTSQSEPARTASVKGEPTVVASKAATPAAPASATPPSTTVQREAPAAIDFKIPASKRGVLIFSKTAGFRHDSIPDGITCLKQICRKEGFDPDATEDASLFTDEILKAYDVIVFLNTTGDVLNDEQQAAMERFIKRGGGFVGVHAASDTEYDWAWYGGLVGAYFKCHPAIQPAQLNVLDSDHLATKHLPKAWQRADEWYDFKAPPASVRRLIEIDESTYKGATMGKDHPMSWCHEYDGGRAFYTALGHTKESYAEPQFVEHLRGAILWAANRGSAAK